MKYLNISIYVFNSQLLQKGIILCAFTEVVLFFSSIDNKVLKVGNRFVYVLVYVCVFIHIHV